MSSGSSDPDAGKPRKPKPVKPRVVPQKPVVPKPVVPKAVVPKAVKPAKPQAVPPKKPMAPKAVPPKAAAPQGGKPAKPARRAPAKAVAPKTPRAKPAEAAAPPTARPGSEALQREAAGDPLIGKTIGRCRIQALVGVGRTARVYAAHYEALDDTVAIKILRRDVAENPVLVERFQSEARAIAKVDNENVLKIYDVGTSDDGFQYMVVELLEGEEIFELLQREERVEAMDALRIVRQAANGLAAAHVHGLVHRDVKPQNLFLLEDGTVKVVDFGLATGIDDKSERVGTPHYMAPEVCENAKAETASDIYGLGITLYHLLTGQPPYAGQDIKGIMRSHISGEPLRPERRLPAGLPKDIGDIVRHLTKHDPLMRPTAPEVVEELDRVGGKELRTKESLKRRRTRSRARSAVARRERAAKGTPAIAAILGAVVLAGGIFAIATSGGGGEEGPDPGREIVVDPDPEPIEEPERIKPVETADQKKAREEAIAKRARSKEGLEAFARAEQWARENWHGPQDTAAVLAKYDYVRNQWRGLAAGDRSNDRIRAIRAKKVHPHPDREWTSADQLAVVKETWRIVRPQVEAKIARHEYQAARELVPPAVSEESGSFSRELDFWRTHTKHLVDFQRAVERGVVSLPQDDRSIATPDGEGVLQSVTGDGFVVRLSARTKTFRWIDLATEDLADIGMRLFSGKSPDKLILQIAFTFAHKLRGPFWDTRLEFSVTPGAGAYDLINKAYKKRFEEWAEKR